MIRNFPNKTSSVCVRAYVFVWLVKIIDHFSCSTVSIEPFYNWIFYNIIKKCCFFVCFCFLFVSCFVSCCFTFLFFWVLLFWFVFCIFVCFFYFLFLFFQFIITYHYAIINYWILFSTYCSVDAAQSILSLLQRCMIPPSKGAVLGMTLRCIW